MTRPVDIYEDRRNHSLVVTLTMAGTLLLIPLVLMIEILYVAPGKRPSNICILKTESFVKMQSIENSRARDKIHG